MGATAALRSANTACDICNKRALAVALAEFELRSVARKASFKATPQLLGKIPGLRDSLSTARRQQSEHSLTCEES